MAKCMHACSFAKIASTLQHIGSLNNNETMDFCGWKFSVEARLRNSAQIQSHARQILISINLLGSARFTISSRDELLNCHIKLFQSVRWCQQHIQSQLHHFCLAKCVFIVNMCIAFYTKFISYIMYAQQSVVAKQRKQQLKLY